MRESTHNLLSFQLLIWHIDADAYDDAEREGETVVSQKSISLQTKCEQTQGLD